MADLAFTPGAYLTKRREAAGKSLREAAMLYAHNPESVTAAELLIGAAEAEQAPLAEAAARRLATCYPLDAWVYLSLVDQLPHSSICRSCGCSWNDPCTDRTGRPCAWANREETTCTACVARLQAA